MSEQSDKHPTPEDEASQAREGDDPIQPRELDDAEDTQTISLLDLMQETSGIAQPDPDHEPTSDVPAPLVASSGRSRVDDEATEELPQDAVEDSSASGPAQPRKQKQQILPPPDRPSERDQEATEVQPLVAFPGAEPASTADQPTQVHRRAQPAPAPASDQTVPAATWARAASQSQGTQQAAVGSTPAATIEPLVVPGAASPRRDWSGCATRALLLTLIAGIVLAALVVSGSVIGYTAIARSLPPPSELQTRASAFETVRIFDREGNLLFSQADPNTGNRLYVPLAQISPHFLNATISTEDKRFYENPGFDVVGIVRAILRAAQEQEPIAGTSTITQQLVRAVLLEEGERTERTFRRKVREIILAAEISRTYEKDEILELYLNEIYFGNLAYGIEAAAQTYYDKPAADLTLAEASLIAGLPQAPALWDPYTAPEKALGRQGEVLSLMLANGYITGDEARAAADEAARQVAEMTPPTVTINHPHFALTVLQQAEDLLGAQNIYRGGLRIFTTLDPMIQDLAEDTVAQHRGRINAAGANNAAMVVTNPGTGEIMALVGSVDFHDEAISGQVNMALTPRQPGSSIKPFVYLTAMEKGWTPATLIWDTATQFPDGVNPPYEPKNYDDLFHGPVRLRTALGNSFNIPAVKAMEFIGVCTFIQNVQKLGLQSLHDDGCDEVGQPRTYGLSLGLGGGEISPVEMAGAFGALANQGRFTQPFAIGRIENSRGEVVYAQPPVDAGAPPIVRPEHAFLLNSILSDDDARQPSFGRNSSLDVPGHEVAVKTGTSGTTRFDVHDGWTIGYTPRIVAAVWVGNTDHSPLGQGQSGTALAAPIWNSFMTQHLAQNTELGFERPPGVVEDEICADSGTQPGPACQNRRMELFVADQPPLAANRDFIQEESIDLWTLLRANTNCQEAVYSTNFFSILVSGNEDIRQRERDNAQQWLEDSAAGQNWAAQRGFSLPLQTPPAESCDSNPLRPRVDISQPINGADITGIMTLFGSAGAPNYGGYQVEYGLGFEPQGWGPISNRRANMVDNGWLAEWDTTLLDYSGPLAVRALIFGPDNPYTPLNDPVTMERRVLVNLLQPTPTPTPTPTETPTPTLTPTPTETPIPTATPEATATPTFVFVTATPEITVEPTIPVLPTDTTEPLPGSTPYP